MGAEKEACALDTDIQRGLAEFVITISCSPTIVVPHAKHLPRWIGDDSLNETNCD